MARKSGRRGSWGLAIPWWGIMRTIVIVVLVAVAAVVASVVVIRSYPQLFFALAERLPRAPVTPIAEDASQDEAFFKYGSIGNEANQGFPFKVWVVLPNVCSPLIDKAG